MAQLHGVAHDASLARPIPQHHPLEAEGTNRQPQTPRSGVITVALRTKAELYQAWMPFIRGGGLFVASTRAHDLGDEVFLVLTLMHDPTKITIRGTVVWLNPANASGARPQGFGVGLENEPVAEELRKLIETLLAGALGSSRPTHTL
jgi:type IV pilus assembly protein PilZ